MKRGCSVTVALSFSLFIYLFYRSDKTVVNELFIFMLTFDTYAAIKSSIVNTIPLNEAMIFSLPGGLWIFCVTALSRDFYIEIRSYKVQVSLFSLLFALGLEFCQFVHLTNGRFDTWDIAFYLLFWLVARYLFQPRGEQQNILSPITVHGFICLACFFSVYLAHVSQ